MMAGKKVLLLDDNEDARVLQTTILESSGYDVTTAANGLEGLEALERECPDIIISDILMPEMDGFEFGMAVKQDARFQEIPFVFYSAQYTDPSDKKLVEKVGADRFIIKPVEIETFLETIEEVLSAYQVANGTDLPEETLDGDVFDREHYRAQAKMLDRKLHELEEEHGRVREREEEYRRLVEELSRDYFIYRHDREGTFTYLSPAVIDILGYTAEEFMAHHDSYLTDATSNRMVSEYTKRGLKGEKTSAYEVELYDKNGSVRTLQISEVPLFDTQQNVIGIEGIARDITAEKEARRLQEQSARKLHSALIDTIRVISLTVEKRDPYTAGHQQRVATLAVAIGEAMQLDAMQLEGLRLGALVHDIGKISIPAEILTKPGQLSEIEYLLIQNHAVAGYEILEHIDFPWPLAAMVLQHHERLDGSGYPKGLKGDEIMLEAKILCVADVVEAMTSDRPYRAGLGFDAAVEEITRNRGTLYDSAVVDTCIDILDSGGFSFQ